jgi:integrase
MTSGAMRTYTYSLLALGEYAKASGSISFVALQRADIAPVNPPTAITVYTSEELETFVSAARGVDLRWWALLTFLVDTGRRIGEALSLRWEWLRLHDTPAYLELPTNKTRRPQYVPLTRRLTEHVFTAANITVLAREQREGRRAFQRSPETFL